MQEADRLTSHPGPLAPRIADSAGLFLSGVLACILIGASTNALNGIVSPTYFTTILSWDGVTDVWRASVWQGAFEGVLFGLLFSTVFTAITAWVTLAACPYHIAVRYLLGAVGGAYAGWVLGGLAAIALAASNPEFYRATFYGVPAEPQEMLRYAWVGGSIWGVELGGAASTVFALVMLRVNWLRRHNAASTDGF